MKNTNRVIVIILVGILSFSAGILIALNYLQPALKDHAKKDLLSEQKTNQETIQSYAEENKSLQKELESQTVNLPKDTRSEQEFKNIERVAKAFTDGFYTNNSENIQEKLDSIQEYLTPKAQGKIVPYWVESKDKMTVEQSKISEKYYANLENVLGEATVTGFLYVSTSYEGDKPFTVRYLIQMDLKKNESNVWQVNEIRETVTTNDVPERFYE
ncbi:hypothetical protein [Enterococcus gallinarum]|uniref:hypothetical protein n=1 Tax=Enterococcus gallinarum TaxID=1353 RepID=UPI001AD6DF67|nr:hypothetical protein [Enterococcus gallinarum]MBO6420059.1 hypothetical protein [Enterococcus gallinarum]MBO6423056.1 hypothetical protein [Enterococcus gallinarum]